jgi:hypothetical protein
MNWLTHIPKDILGHIFTFCGDKIEIVMKWVSKTMMMHIARNFPQIIDSQCTLREYGIKFGYPKIIGWTINISYDHNNMIADEYLDGKELWMIHKFLCVYIHAVRDGHLEMVKWIFEIRKDYNYVKYNISNIADYASLYGNISVLQWAYEIDPTSIDMKQTSLNAIQYGYLEQFKWIITSGYIVESGVYSQLVLYDRVSMFKWARSNDPNWNPAIFHEMAERDPLIKNMDSWITSLIVYE